MHTANSLHLSSTSRNKHGKNDGNLAINLQHYNEQKVLPHFIDNIIKAKTLMSE